MKKFLRTTLLTSLFFIFLSAEGFGASFTLNRVIDGDTFEVIAADGKKIQVDLAGIDAPEMPGGKKTKSQPFSQKAMKTLSEMILDKVFSYKVCGREGNDRILAVVYSEGKNVNLELVRAGLAEVYQGKLPPGFDIAPYKAAEKEAKDSAKGIWSLGSVYISPKVWRRVNRNSF